MENQQNTPSGGQYLYHLNIPGSGLPFRWQGFLIYFFMWIYGLDQIWAGTQWFDGTLLAEIDSQMQIRYLPNVTIFLYAMGIVQMLLGAVIIFCRFLLARYKRCALPVFFTVSAVDMLLLLLLPLGIYWAFLPWSSLKPLWGFYVVYLQQHMVLLSVGVRLVLLLCHGVYYYKRRSNFVN